MLRRPLTQAVAKTARRSTPVIYRGAATYFVRRHASAEQKIFPTLESNRMASQIRWFSSDNFPSHIKVKLPALSPTMEMGTIVSWDKQEGDKLSEGDLLCEIETDKATMGFETPEEGYLAKILVAAGTKDIPLGKLLCIIVSDEGDIAAFKDFKDTAAAAPPPAAAAAPAAAAPIPAAPKPVAAQITQAVAPLSATGSGGRIMASPFAKLLAASQGLDLASVAGTGPGGRIVASDLSAARPATAATASAPAAQAPAAQRVESYRYTDIDLSNVRQTNAKRLVESKQQIPHYSLTVEIEVDKLLKLQEELNSTLKEEELTLNDFVVKASALACKKVPAANSSFMNTFIREYKAVDVSISVSSPEGLITPIVFNADSKGLAAISKETKELTERAQGKQLTPEEFIGGTFTVSNLGSSGIDHFSAIINPPQACILSVGKTTDVPKPCSEQGYRIVKVMKVTLSCDHRVVDGAVGAQWLQHFRNYLEKPHTMLL